MLTMTIYFSARNQTPTYKSEKGLFTWDLKWLWKTGQQSQAKQAKSKVSLNNLYILTPHLPDYDVMLELCVLIQSVTETSINPDVTDMEAIIDLHRGASMKLQTF